jgi:pyruvate ferredoxin oxidoreductase alpha subunit
VKIKVLRPAPRDELRRALARAERIVIPEFNRTGWLAREVASMIPGNDRIVAGPRVYGGMTMPPEVILDAVRGTRVAGV